MTPPSNIAHYRITSKLGEGGMGAVYRATDTKLNRDVAIKVLPPAFAEDSARMQRFDREAQVLASLNHPNIAAIYGIEQGAIVMELVEGQTLEARLVKGPLPLAQALAAAAQIAGALTEAHRKGIVHRDLKPGNLMLTKSGIKILDFGLAKMTVRATPGDLTLTQTQPGTVMGTPLYMSPEQAQGRDVDARSDIFAFGVVLHEMVTGRRVFDGKSRASVMAAILERPAPALAPPALDRVVRRCLAKDPDDRWQSARDILTTLEWIDELATVVDSSPTRPSRALLYGVAMTAVAAIALGVFLLRQTPPDPPLVRFQMAAPEKTVFNMNGNAVGPVAVSFDGRRLVFSATGEAGGSQLWSRSLDTLAAQPLAGTEDAVNPFWSPDGRFLGFFADGKLKKIESTGGTPVTLCEAKFGCGGTWNREGVIVFSPGSTGPLFRVSMSGGSPSPVTALDTSRHEANHKWPWFLPDGRHFLYTTRVGFTGSGSIRVASLDSNESRILAENSANPAYALGYLLYLRGTTLVAQSLNLKRLATAAEPVPVAEHVLLPLEFTSRGVWGVSENGILAYQSGVGPKWEVDWRDRGGKSTLAHSDSGYLHIANLSPDGKSAAISITDRSTHNEDIWLYDFARGIMTRFTSDPAEETAGVWSPDGASLIFDSNRKGHFDLYRKPSNGANTEELLYEDGLEKTPTSWSPDGKFLLFQDGIPGTATGHLWILPLTGVRTPVPFAPTKFHEGGGQFSPDGRWIAYYSNESGKQEIYIAPFPGPGVKRQVSVSGGRDPRWRRDGKEIFYVGGGHLMAAEVHAKGASIEVGTVQQLIGRIRTGRGYQYDVSADGQRFLVVSAPDQTANDPLTIVENWTAAFKK